MAIVSMNRRRFLLSTVALSAAGTLVGTSKALALSTEPMVKGSERSKTTKCADRRSDLPTLRLRDNFLTCGRSRGFGG